MHYLNGAFAGTSKNKHKMWENLRLRFRCMCAFSILCHFIVGINILTCSVIESREDVASSNTRMGDPFKIARAIATLCFSPPDSFNPRSPT
jgi:hypothetical protein